DEVFLAGDLDEALSSYELYRPGPVYKDPVTREELGMEAVHLGVVSLLADADAEVQRGQARSARREIKAGDRLLARENSSMQYTFHPRAPDTELEGIVIG